MSNIQAQVPALQNLANRVARTTTDANREAGNQVVVCDYVLNSGNRQCGPRTITGWTQNVDYYKDADPATNTETATFNTGTGIFTPPVAGYYKICANSR